MLDCWINDLSQEVDKTLVLEIEYSLEPERRYTDQPNKSPQTREAKLVRYIVVEDSILLPLDIPPNSHPSMSRVHN